MKCSIIILNWNGAEMLRRYLPSVVEHTTLPDCEIVVADNGSTDNSLEVLRTAFPSVRTLVLDRNYGFAEGYNRALAGTESTYTVLLNSDVEVTEGWLEPLLAFMDTHPDVAAVQPKIRSWLYRDRFEHAGAAGGFINALGYPYCRGRVLWHVEQDKGQYDTPAEVAWTSGACMCVRTAVYKDCGGLDAAFFAHMEEIDLCWRMRNKGWRLVCLPQSVVYHLGGGSLNYESPRKTYLNHRNNLLMIYKNKQHPWGVLFIRFFLDYAAALFYLLQGRPQACKAVFTARRDYRRMRKMY
ncbi:MAG: glycosyltransferase family 2 protein [Paludibacteraceae bacterium]|nr:glycosyltransferase family 2 protein [Paludibacteraceae bacterium]MBR0065280.1 glycosyltransferase family 2 protein [Paludibacteraceae bacterium]